MLMFFPSTHGDQPTRGVPGAPGPVIAGAGGIDLGSRCVARRYELRPLHLLQRADVIRGKAEILHHQSCELTLLLSARNVSTATRLRSRTMKQARRGRHAQQRRHFRTATGLAIDHDAIGITAEVGDVLVDPSQRRDEIRHPDVCRIFVSRSADLRRIEEPENVQAMIDGDLHHVVMSRHLRAFMRRQFVRGAETVAAAVEIDHHRALAAQGRRPDVELEHVLALPTVVPILDERLFDARPRMQGLRAVRAVDQRGILIRPRSRRFRGKPAILTRGCLTVRNSFEGEDAAVEIAAHFAVLRLRDCGTRRRQISGALMSSRS